MKKILVIDDAEFILESTSTLLKFEGYDVYTAVDGVEGLEKTNELRPDLILCDISMPRLDGYGVLDQLKATPELEHTPFIFLTAFTEKSNMRTGMEKGADDFLVKPYTRDELIAAIDAQWQKYMRIEKQVSDKVEVVSKNVTMALPHEFRTVLNEVIGSARYLNSNAESVLPGDIQESTNDIISSANRLIKITENFLIYTQIELISGNIQRRNELKKAKAEEPSAIFVDTAGLKAMKHTRTQDLVVQEMAEDLSIIISTESYYKIVDELLDNAFRFSDPESKVIINSYIKNNNYYCSITDQGRGMTSEQINRISALSQFKRDVYEQQGVGLGLVIAKKMVELYDGNFVITSEESRGTTILFNIPVCFRY